MPVSDHEEPGVNLPAWKSGDSIAAVPIKKRRFILSQSSSPPTQTPSLPPEDSERPWKKSCCSEAESSASDSSAQPALGTRIITDVSLEAKGESLNSRNINMAHRHEDHMESNPQELGLKIATSAIKGVSVAKDSNMDDKSALLSDMQNNKLLSTLDRPSELPVGERSGEGKFALSDKSAFQRVASMSEWQLASSRDGKDNGNSSVKQSRVHHSLYDLPLGVRDTAPHNSYSNFNPVVDPVHHHVNRSNWDLNVPMDNWDSSASISVMQQDGHDSSTGGGIHKQKLETHFVVQTTPGESSSLLQKRDNLRRGNFSMHSIDCNDAEVGLDLQLKPPSRPELCIDWGAMAPADLSLSLTGSKVVISSKAVASTIDISSKAIKPEPCEEVSQNGIGKVGTTSLKSIGFRHVKSEPCDEGSQGRDAMLPGSGDDKSACDGMVKSEAPEEPPQESIKRPTGKSPDLEGDNHQLTPCSTGEHADASETKVMDLNAEVVSVGDELHDGSKMLASAEITARESGGATVDSISQAAIPDCNKNSGSGELHNSTCLPQDAEGNEGKTTDLVSKSLISEGKGLNRASETCEVAGQASNSLIEPVVSGGVKEPVVFDGMSEGSAEMDCSDDDNFASSNFIATDEHQVDSYGNGELGESSQERIYLSADIQTEQNYYNEYGSNNSHNANNDAGERTLKQGGDDAENEDGKVRDLMLMSHGANVSLLNKGSKVVLGKETTDTIGPADMPTVMPSKMDAEEKEAYTDETKTDHSTEKIISVLCDVNNDMNLSSTKVLPESSVMEAPKTSSSKAKLIKTFHKTTQNHPQMDKGSEMKSKSIEPPSAEKVVKSGDKGPRQEIARGSVPSTKHSISSKKSSPLNDVAIKHVDGKERNSQIKMFNSVPNKSSFGKTKCTSSWSISSQTERGRLTDESHRRDRTHSRGARIDRSGDRLLKYESEKNQDQSVDKRGPDFINHMKDDNRLGSLYRDRNCGPPGAPELHDHKGFRFSRPRNRGEAAFAVKSDVSVGSAGRMGRRPLEDGPSRLYRFPSRRQSPGPREGPAQLDAQIAGYPVRDASTSRFIGRDGPDPLLLAHEEKIMNGLPDDMMDPSPFPHPRLIYDRADGDFLRRERRSHSPIHRRVPMYLHRAHSPHRWAPTRRPPDAFDGHPELIRRSPPIIGVDRLREDMMVRRHGSPFPPRLLDDMRDIHPLEEHDLPRPGRVLHRNIRRFDLIGPQETASEYFGHLPVNQLHVLEGDDEFAVRNNFDERRGFVPPFEQRPIVSEGEDCLPYPIENGPRPIRFCPQAEEMFSDRGGPRDFDGRIRNEIGNIANRRRAMAEREDDYRYHGAPGWRDGGLNDVKLKRRRL